MLQEHVKGSATMTGDSSRNTRMNEERTVINTVIQYTTIRTVRSFSIPPSKAEVYKRFCSVAQREAGSRGFSQVLIKALEEYSQRHEQNSPQLKLTAYTDANPGSPLRVLCLDLDGALQDGRIHCKRRGFWIPGKSCTGCERNRLRRTSRRPRT